MKIHGRRAVRCEPLERRMLLSLAPAGPEFRVNTFTTVTQADPTIAADADGDFVIAWASDFQDGSLYGIYAQRYNVSGVPQGSEFRVNAHTIGRQFQPTVAMDADGDFVIVWESFFQDGSGYGIYAQRYSAAGAARGNELRVNTFTTNSQSHASVGLSASGDFVIAWDSDGQDGGGLGVYAQRYSAAGIPQGSEFRVNSTTAGNQSRPAIAVHANGDFVVAWSGTGGGDSAGIFAQRFNAAGVTQGAEFLVNSFTTDVQTVPSVAVDASGDFVIAWQSNAQDGSLGGIFAQRFNAAGTPQGTEFRVNTTTTNTQILPAVGIDADGDFLVTWSSLAQDGSVYGIYAQSYNAAGVAQGGEFRVNTSTQGQQFASVAGMSSDGDVVVAWHSPDGSNLGVFAQRYNESNPDTAAPIIGGVVVNENLALPYSTHEGPLAQIAVSFSENMSTAGGVTGPNSVTNPANWLLTRNGNNITADISLVTFGFNATRNRFEAVVNVSSAHTSGNFLIVAKDSLGDIAGNRLDGNLDGSPGGSAPFPFSLASLAARGAEFRVNTFVTNRQSVPEIAADADGDFVVAWTSYGQDGSSAGVFAQRYNASGVAQGLEFQVNTLTTDFQIVSGVAMDDRGNFVVTWSSGNIFAFDIFARRYDAAGTPLSGEFRVNTFTTGSQQDSSIAMDADGDFVVTWTSYSQDGSGAGVFAQRYSALGVAQGGEFRANTFTLNNQNSSKVAMDASGDFAIAWTSDSQDGSDRGVYAQRYNAQGAALGGEFRVNTFTPNFQGFPDIAMDADGDFVVVWESMQDGDDLGIYAQRYNSSGLAQGAEFHVNSHTTGRQHHPRVALDDNGDVVVAWSSREQDGSSYGIYTQRYNALGVLRGGEFQVNTFTSSAQEVPSVAVDDDGDLVIVWQSNYQDGSSYGIYAQRYGLDLTPVVAALADTPDPVVSGNSLTLSATDAVDDNAVQSVSFYRETNGLPGLQVGFRGDLFVGTDTVPNAGVWSVNAPTSALGNGAYTYWAQATDDAGLIGTPASTTNTVINAPAPAVNVSSFLFATLPQQLRFTFNQDVSASLTLDDIVVTTLPGGPVITPSGLTYDNATNTATVTLAGVLPDANYRATLLAAGITSPGGTPMAANLVFNFFFLSADANHDARVNLDDFNILAANFGQSPRDFTQGDFNYDTIVNLDDFNLLAARFGQMVGPGVLAQDHSFGDTNGAELGSLVSDVGLRSADDELV